MSCSLTNQDTVTDAGEVGIGGANVVSTSHSQTLSNGTKATDGFAALADIDANHDGVVNEAVLPLPDMQGAGQVRSLHEAATLSPALAALITQFATNDFYWRKKA